MQLNNFLSKQIVRENLFLRNRNLIKFIANALILSLALCVIAQIAFLATSKFVFTHSDAVTPELRQRYESAKQLSKQTSINNSNFLAARVNHTSPVEVTNAAIAAMNDNIYVKTITINKDQITLSGEAKDLDAVNNFISKFKISKYPAAILEKVSNNDAGKNVAFSITTVRAKERK